MNKPIIPPAINISKAVAASSGMPMRLAERLAAGCAETEAEESPRILRAGVFCSGHLPRGWVPIALQAFKISAQFGGARYRRSRSFSSALLMMRSSSGGSSGFRLHRLRGRLI